MVLLILLFVPFVFGARDSITLLTIGESINGDRRGGTADLFLEVKPGSGRVFINSFPFTREDTQVSIRFAREVACNFLEIDCSRLDFFYSIDIGSSSVGGPSAGAAIAVLTVGVLNGDSLAKNVVITGTINSGGIVGPVSGLEEKAVAARDAGFSKILVPKRSILVEKTLNYLNDSVNNSGINPLITDSRISQINSSNNKDQSNKEISDDINNTYINDSGISSNRTVFYADSLVVSGIEIVPISTLEEVLFEFTNINYPNFSFDISIPVEYQEIMGRVSSRLCDRSLDILNGFSDDFKENNSVVLAQVNESMSLGFSAHEVSDYYSSASFCFTANTALRSLEFKSKNESFLDDVAFRLNQSIDNSFIELKNRPLMTMSDLETYMIVKERLFEAKSLLEEEDYIENLGYIFERRYSAIAWSSFFEFSGREVTLDEAFLSNACISKISEAEERLSYLDFVSGIVFDRSELEEARNIHRSGDFAFCIFKAAKVKADANAIILSMSLSKDKVGELINDQLLFARMQINKQGENFPILGYSYYNYASNLRDSRPQLSMVFAEYASEFSNLDMYFPSKRRVPFRLVLGAVDNLFLGILLGIIICFVVFSFFILSFKFFSKKLVKTKRGSKSRNMSKKRVLKKKS